MRASRGFTLIEMVAVLALLAVISGLAVLSLGGVARRGSFDDALSRLAYADRQVRDLATRQGAQVGLVIDLEHGTLSRHGPGAIRTPLDELPAGIHIEQVVFGFDRSRTGLAEVAFSKDGRSNTYAVQLSDGRALRRWLVVAGMTGQVMRVDDEREIENILEQTTAGAHAR